MLTYALTYHQVMPAFLDFLFPFGRQEYARDFHFTGFREETRLNPTQMGLSIPELGRSGRDIQMCYSLKSVEASKGQLDWPWSIRQTAVYHSFDAMTGKAVWIMVKGNKLMKKRLELSTSSTSVGDTRDFGSPLRALASSLATHLIICDWCGEDWRWYITFLEEALQERTRRTLAVKVEAQRNPMVGETPKRAVTWSTLTSSMPEKGSVRTQSFFSKSSTPMSPLEPPLSPPGPPVPPGMSLSPDDSDGGPNNERDFTFTDLQRVQFIEDKANEVYLVLESNMNVLADLKTHYRSNMFLDLDPLAADPVVSLRGRGEVVERFESRISGVINDLKMQQSRVQALLRLLADRKSLVSHLSTRHHFY